MEVGLRTQAEFNAVAGTELETIAVVTTGAGEISVSDVTIVGAVEGKPSIAIDGKPAPITAGTGFSALIPFVFVTVVLPVIGLTTTRYFLKQSA